MPRIEQADVLFSHLQIVPDIRSRKTVDKNKSNSTNRRKEAKREIKEGIIVEKKTRLKIRKIDVFYTN